LPSEDEKQYIILIDDVIRHNLKSILIFFDYEDVLLMVKSVRTAVDSRDVCGSM
jgi:polyphosphate kinase